MCVSVCVFVCLCVSVRTAVGKLEGQNTALMEVQLVLVRFGDVQDFHVAALHPHSQPLACRTVAQREDLEVEREGRKESKEGGRSYKVNERKKPHRGLGGGVDRT